MFFYKTMEAENSHIQLSEFQQRVVLKKEKLVKDEKLINFKKYFLSVLIGIISFH